jgi:predicted negative regulator of RcsB-dependent stress response
MPRVIKKRSKKKNVGVGAEADVVDRLSGIRDQFREKQRTVLIYGAIVAVVIIAVVGFLLYRYTEQGKSQQLEYEAYKIYYNEHQIQPVAGRENYKKALDLFKQAYKKEKSARVLLYIASTEAELGSYDEALKSLGQLIKDYPSDKDILPLAYQKMADIQLQKGNKEGALKTLDSLYKSEGTIYKDLALVESARILESEGKKEEALAKYKELSEKFKDSPFLAEASAKLAEKAEKKEG